MTGDEFITERIHEYYWHNNLNCATTMLKILAEYFHIQLHAQVIDSAIGMHGAGCFGGQCGLVEGTLMFLGIYGAHKHLPEQNIIEACYAFADKFQLRFGSLLCRELRPEGFRPENPPHLCEPLTKDTIGFSLGYITRIWP